MTAPLLATGRLGRVSVPSATEVLTLQERARVRWERDRDGLPRDVASREDELVRDRLVDALTREDEAIKRWCEQARDGRPTALLVHRHAWLRDRVRPALEARGWQVLDVGDQGAEAIGALVALQPEVLLTSDRVAGASGTELVARGRELSPSTVVVVQVDQDVRAGSLAEAGADLVLSHRSTWLELVEAVDALAPRP